MAISKDWFDITLTFEADLPLIQDICALYPGCLKIKTLIKLRDRDVNKLIRCSIWKQSQDRLILVMAAIDMEDSMTIFYFENDNDKWKLISIDDNRARFLYKKIYGLYARNMSTKLTLSQMYSKFEFLYRTIFTSMEDMCKIYPIFNIKSIRRWIKYDCENLLRISRWNFEKRHFLCINSIYDVSDNENEDDQYNLAFYILEDDNWIEHKLSNADFDEFGTQFNKSESLDKLMDKFSHTADKIENFFQDSDRFDFEKIGTTLQKFVFSLGK